MKYMKLMLGSTALLSVYPSLGYSYLDPGTGSVLLQILFGGVAGVLVIVNLYWSRIRAFFGMSNTKEEGGPGDRQAE